MRITHQILRNIGIALCLATTVLASSAYARPTVSGNTISWPDNAWYQVENRATQEIVCQGGRGCDVPDGAYWVSWFFPDGSGGGGTRVVVGNPVEETITRDEFPDYLNIEGNTISWTLGGWYQIQDAINFSEICNGEDACTVPSHGDYIVINHSFGLRTTLSVTSASDNNDVEAVETEEIVDTDPVGVILPDVTPVQRRPARPVATGNVISWPDDGFAWYQVEDRLTGEIVCAGGAGCTLPDGVYWASWFYTLNDGLAAGGSTRIILGNPDAANITRDEFPSFLMINDKTITWSLGGWYQIQDANTFESVCNGDDSCTVPTAGEYIVINHNLGLRTTLEVL